MFWNKYPYTDFSQINLDEFARRLAEFERRLEASLKASDAGVFTVEASIQGTYQDMVLNKTWKEIMDAVKAGKYVQLQDNTASGGTDDYYTFGFIAAVGHSSHYDVVVYLTGEGGWSSYTLYTTSANGYPQTHNV